MSLNNGANGEVPCADAAIDIRYSSLEFGLLDIIRTISDSVTIPLL